MKKILVVFSGALDVGGIERSLIGILDSIDYKNYNVDLFLYAHRGIFFKLINPNVNLLPENKELSYLRSSIIMKIINLCLYSTFVRIIDEIKLKLFNVQIINDLSWKKILNKCVPPLDKEYDIVLNFFLPFDLSIDKVNTKIKVGWIHTDYTVEKNDLNDLYRQYSKMDYIAAVSDQVKNSFIQIFPNLESKVIVIENILLPEYILKQSKMLSVNQEMDDNCVKLLSIGRFCTAKNFDNVPAICKYIIDRGLNIKWYIIGYGGDEQLIKDKIQEYDMSDHVIILGKKENPYPYIKACDYYIQPSRYEGKAVTVREAQILCKPVIITDYPTSKSQIDNGVDGVIVPMDNEKCAQGIIDFIKNKSLQQKIVQYLQEHDYSNASEVEKIYQLMED